MGTLNRTRHFVLIGILLALSLLLRVAVSHQSVRRIPVVSDHAIAVLQAQEIARGARPLFIAAQPYQFPLEAYFTAPFVRWLPSMPAGAWVMHLTLAFSAFVLWFWLLARVHSFRDNLPCFLLALFPSAYLLLILHGYVASHSPSFVLWWIAYLAAAYLPEKGTWQTLALAAISGCALGLAFAGNMLTLAVAVPLVIVILLQPGMRRVLVRGTGLGFGFALGLAPFLIGLWLHPTAQRAVTGRRSVTEALRMVWSPTLNYTLPGALGINPTRFPDSVHHVEVLAPLRPFFGVLFLLILLAATLRLLWEALSALRKRRFPVLTLEAAMAGAAWLSLLLFVLSRRSGATEYRYVIAAVWALPFLFGTVFRGIAARWRGLGLCVSLAWVGINLWMTFALVRSWRDPDYALEVLHSPCPKPAIEWLNEHGYTHVVASHWTAYRLTLLSGSSIMAAQPFNERFPGWPVPFKDEVDAADRIAYVLKHQSRFLTPARFEEHLRTMGGTAARHQAGGYVIYHDFEQIRPEYGGEVPPDQFHVIPSDSPEAAENMLDGKRETFWRSAVPQSEGMYVKVRFEKPLKVSRVVMDLGWWGHDNPRSLRVDLQREDGRWQPHHDPVPGALEPFQWIDGKPVYGRALQQTIRLEDAPPARALRVVVVEPRPPYCWTLAGLRIYADK